MVEGEVPKRFRYALFWSSIVYCGLGLPLIAAGFIWDNKYMAYNGILFSVYRDVSAHELIENVRQPSLFWPGLMVIIQGLPAVILFFKKSRPWASLHFFSLILTIIGVTAGTAMSANIWVRFQYFEDLQSCINLLSNAGCYCKFWNNIVEYAQFTHTSCETVLRLNELVLVYFAFCCLCCCCFVVTYAISFATCIKMKRIARQRRPALFEEQPATISTVNQTLIEDCPPYYLQYTASEGYGAISGKPSAPPPYAAIDSR